MLPTLESAALIAGRFIAPAWKYAEGKVAGKVPVVCYLLDDVFNNMNAKIDKGLQSIDPALFKSNKRYVTLVIRPDNS